MEKKPSVERRTKDGTEESGEEDKADPLVPSIFQELKDYVAKNEDPWCTPGHQGGVGFRRNALGKSFYDFFGENIFKADVSSSMSEIGSILGHGAAHLAAENAVKQIFGADHAHLISNGTTTSNKLVFLATTTMGNLVVADRNCHKSIVQSLIMTRTVPIYLKPERNAYGIIGPITQATIATIAGDPKLVVITNSTYDGLTYDVNKVKKIIGQKAKNILFDEAWYAHGIFSPLYANRYAMGKVTSKTAEVFPTVFATQSTHKLLSAFSMASVVLIKSGSHHVFNPENFDETWMMHTSTSPFYPLLASIEVGTQMMRGAEGQKIVADMQTLAVQFRKKLKELNPFFRAWQPDKFNGKDITEVPDATLINTPDLWVLKPGDKWHGFSVYTAEDNIMLDPIKLTILTPGIKDGEMEETGIPALVVAKYLGENKIVIEKAGFYNILFLFGPGASKEKSDRLLAALKKFKECYDKNVDVKSIMPELVKSHNIYEKIKLKDLCDSFHTYLKEKHLISIMNSIAAVIPRSAMIPALAYEHFVQDDVSSVPLTRLENQISAVLLAAYPPGIPVVMPGEMFSKELIFYFKLNEEIENLFPGFDIEIHGVTKKPGLTPGRIMYEVICIGTDIVKKEKAIEKRMEKWRKKKESK